MALKVFWHKCGFRSGNFGDNLTPLLLDYLDIDYQWAPPVQADFIGIGSVCQEIPEGFRGTIWSTGNLDARRRNHWPHARVLALRGRLTMQRTCTSLPADICLGDGGLLCYLIAPAEPKRYRLGILPHYVHAGHQTIAGVVGRSTDICLVDVCDHPRQVLTQVAQCEAILSTSLHGLVLADSLGIPNRRLTVSGKKQPLGGDFKFEDYYSAFGRQPPPALQLREHDDLDALASQIGPSHRPGIEQIQAQLLDRLRESLGETQGAAWSWLSMPLAERGAAVAHYLTARNKEDGAAVENVSIPRSVPLEEMIDDLKADPPRLAQFCIECLSRLRAMWAHDVYHRCLSVDTIGVQAGRPVFRQDGWAVVHSANGTDAIRSSSIQQRRTRDFRQLGEVFARLLPDEHTPLHAVVELMVGSDSNGPRLGLDQVTLLFTAAKANMVAQPAEPSPSDDVPFDAEQELCLHLAEQLAIRRRQMRNMARRTRELEQRLWAAESESALYELDAVLPTVKAVIVVDEARFDLQALRRIKRKMVRFGEHAGEYAGRPPDGAAALRQLDQFPLSDIEYIAFPDVTHWWLDYYSELRHYLKSDCSTVFRNERWCVFRRTPVDSSIEVHAS